MKQAASNIFLIRPSGFNFNTETAVSNSFQQKINSLDKEAIKQKVFEEFEAFAAALQSKGITVTVFDDTETPKKPDAVFPNNWITFHPDGTVILYPMCAANRQYERRQDIIDSLKTKFKITAVTDLSHYEKENRFLEGTGSMIFDHNHKIAYACLSPRTDKELFITVTKSLNYTPVYFYAHNQAGVEIYHTNVMMNITERLAVICLESITDEVERRLVAHSLLTTGHQLIEITFEQMNSFAGNMLALKNNNGKDILALSQSAFNSLNKIQKTTIEKYCELVPLSITTIETIGGGSARCMIAEIFCEPVIH